MSGGCGEFALVSLQLLLLIFHFPSPALSNDSALERCVYRSWNLNVSHDIICSSSHLHGSTYYHQLDESGMPRAAANMDMIHCEAVSRRYNDLSLYRYAHQDGIIESQIPSGRACVISDRGANCTQVILFVNLTYYDQRNDSIIPVCALTTSSRPNLECFCIRYLTLESSPDCCDSERCKSVTTEAMMKNATTIKTEPQTEPQTVQPTNGCPAVAGASGRVPAATFQGTISVLIIVIVLQAIVIIMMIGAIYIRKKSSICIRQPVNRSNSTSEQVRPYFRSSSLTVQQSRTVESDNGERVSDDEHEIEHDPFEERHKLLNRSMSCPVGSPTAIDPDGFDY